MPDTARRSPAPWIAAAVAGALAIALAVVYFVVVRPDHRSKQAQAKGGFTGTERTAMDAATTEAVNLQSLTRAHFDRDWARALAGTTGPLHSDLANSKATTLKTLQQKKLDLRADVTHTALLGPSEDGKGYVVLVTMLGYQVSGGQQSLPTPQRLQLTVVEVKGKWLANDVSQRGLS
jgi:hypothetical protein